MAEDKLRRRCEEILANDERILLDADALCIIFPRVAPGRAFLTEDRLIWIRRTMFPLLDRLLFWMPKLLQLPLRDISEVTHLEKHGWWSAAFVRIAYQGDMHHFQLSRGPFPLQLGNAKVTREWFTTLNKLLDEANRSDEKPDDFQR